MLSEIHRMYPLWTLIIGPHNGALVIDRRRLSGGPFQIQSKFGETTIITEYTPIHNEYIDIRARRVSRETKADCRGF